MTMYAVKVSYKRNDFDESDEEGRRVDFATSVVQLARITDCKIGLVCVMDRWEETIFRVPEEKVDAFMDFLNGMTKFEAERIS